MAERVGGKDHKFRFVQMPFSIDANEAISGDEQIVDGKKMSVINAC